MERGKFRGRIGMAAAAAFSRRGGDPRFYIANK